MSHFDKNLPLEKYKNRLLDYLHMQGFDVEEGRLCSCPWHDDSTPSFNIYTDSQGYPAFKCFGCERKGDIYSAIGYCTGKAKVTEQFEEADKIFGTGDYTPAQYTPPPKKEKFTFTPDKEALAKLTQWLESLPNKDQNILSYFKQRIEYKTSGKASQYPLSQEQLNRLVTFFFWWPGKKATEQALGRALLFRAGVAYIKTYNDLPLEEKDTLAEFPQVGRSNQMYFERTTETCWRWNNEDYKYERIDGEPREIAWYHPGILAKSAEGFKLLYMNEKTFASEKRNPRTGVSFFPIPSELPEEKPIVLMEGEIDAVLCQTCGIENAFSMGGLGNLSVPKIEKFILPKNIPEITLFADNDKAPKCQSQKAFGLMPYSEGDAIMETVPEKLIRAGFKGKIKVTSLPADCGFKDPDDAIRAGRFDLVQEAIANARDYEAFEKPEKTKKTAKKPDANDMVCTEWEAVPIKFLRSFLKKIKYENLDQDDALTFAAAAYNSCKDEDRINAILEWSGSGLLEDDIKDEAKKQKELFKKPMKVSEHPLYEIAFRHGASKYLLDKLEEIMVPAAEILNMIEPIPTVFPVDYEKMIGTKNFIAFLHYCDHAFASYAVAAALKNRLLYISTEDANYVFIKNNWVFIPSIATEAHAILVNALLCYLRKNPREKKIVIDCLQTIGSNSFRQKLTNDLNHKEAQFYHDEKKNPILFDSYPVRETLTLKDGVLDFSGDKIKFRKGTPEEYRLSVLPYTCAEIKNATTPSFFLKALDLDFYEPTKEVLEKNPTRTKDTLLYYLSLIPSRNVSKNYSCFMTGPGGTGKSTLISAIEEVFTNECCAQLKSEVLVAKKKGFDNENGPSPEIAELEGKLVSITMELPEDGRLNADKLKRLTGSDMISARQLRRDLHKFRPTAQIVIVGNELPSFYKHDSGIIRRLLVFHFNVEHAKRMKSKDYRHLYKDLPSDSSKMVEMIKAEAPGIIKLLAEKYIELKTEHDLIIPTSQECENAKSQYIENQSKDTDEFYENCIKFTPNDDNSFIFSKDLYKCYLNYKGYQEGSSEALKQRNFIFYLKKDHQELGGANYTQKRRNALSVPEWGFKFISFTDLGHEYLMKDSQGSELGFESKNQTTHESSSATTYKSSPEPDDDPFAGATPPPPDSPDDDDDGDGDKYDIY